MLDFTYERRLELATRDAREEGIKLGISQGRAEMQSENDSLRDENEALQKEIESLKEQLVMK